jgi:hypothetical protein
LRAPKAAKQLFAFVDDGCRASDNRLKNRP